MSNRRKEKYQSLEVLSVKKTKREGCETYPNCCIRLEDTCEFDRSNAPVSSRFPLLIGLREISLGIVGFDESATVGSGLRSRQPGGAMTPDNPILMRPEFVSESYKICELLKEHTIFNSGPVFLMSTCSLFEKEGFLGEQIK